MPCDPKNSLIAIFDGLLGSVEPTGGTKTMIFILITKFESFIQQQTADALANLLQGHHRYAFFWFKSSSVKNHNVNKFNAT